jgi:hypothetical protein
MSAKTAPRLIPARLDFGAEDGRAESWGKLMSLTPAGAQLTTLARLTRGQTVILAFEVNGEPFSELHARVMAADEDADGFCAAELDFTDILARRRLSTILLDALSR